MTPHCKIAFLFVMAALLNMMPACNIDRIESVNTIKFQYYSFEPQTVIQSILHKKKDIFSPLDVRPENVPLVQQAPVVGWAQDDYLRIAKALHEYAWGETLESWKLNSMSFSLGCIEIGAGLQKGRFNFFKIIRTSEDESRIVETIDIDPNNKVVYLFRKEYHPKLVDWIVVDLNKLKLSANDALQIAESNGGQKERLAAADMCSIDIMLVPGSANYRGWFVGYGKDKDADWFFSLDVDPYTGKYK